MSSDSDHRPLRAEPWEILEGKAVERGQAAQAELEPERREAKPGDLYLLPETVDLPVEWAVLESHPSHPRLWRAVPADTNPLAGSDDVEIPAEAPGGPLSLRCRFPVWLEAAILAPERRTGRISPAHAQEAVHKCRQIESGDVSASALAREVDVVPEYRDWIGEVASQAPGLAPRILASEPVVPIRPRPRWRPVSVLAAVLSCAVAGLSLWVLVLRRDVDRLDAPILDMDAQQVVLGSELRSPIQVILPESRDHLVLVLVLDRTTPEAAGWLEIDNKEGRILWQSSAFHTAPGEELHLVLPRRLLGPGSYRIRLMSGSLRLAESVIEVLPRASGEGE